MKHRQCLTPSPADRVPTRSQPFSHLEKKLHIGPPILVHYQNIFAGKHTDCCWGDNSTLASPGLLRCCHLS
jgi:hypothetical protein